MTGKDGVPGRCHIDSLLTVGHKVKAIRAGHPGVLQQEIWRWSEQLAPATVARQYTETEQQSRSDSNIPPSSRTASSTQLPRSAAMLVYFPAPR